MFGRSHVRVGCSVCLGREVDTCALEAFVCAEEKVWRMVEVEL